jgi:addiction module HigA family antidote
MAYTHFFHPGIVLRDYYLAESGITQSQLAKGTGIPASRISELCNAKRDITADMALRLGTFLGVGAQLFLNLQNHYDLEEAKAAQKAARVRVRPWKYAEADSVALAAA